MLIEIHRDKLLQAIQLAERMTAKNPSLPVLGSILLETSDNNVVIRATNLEIGFTTTISAEIKEKGSVAIPGQILSKYIQALETDKNLILQKKENNLFISSKKHKTTIKTIPVDDFPSIPEFTPEQTLTIKTKDFIQGIRSVVFAASTSGVRPELSSVYVYQDDSNLVFVATDSFRLAEKKIYNTNHQIPPILLPTRSIQEIIAILESSDTVEIGFSKNQISIKTISIYAVVRVIEGIFPDYRQIFPKDKNTTEVVVLRKELEKTLKISTMFSDKFNKIKLDINPSMNKFEIQTQNADVGEQVSTIEAVLEGKEIQTVFNQKYMTDGIAICADDSVVLKFYGEQKPVFINNVTDNSFLYLVMPMNR